MDSKNGVDVRNSMLNAIETLIDSKSYSYDKTFIGRIISVNGNNYYNVKINGKIYNNIKGLPLFQFKRNGLVYCFAPQGNLNQLMIILSLDDVNINVDKIYPIGSIYISVNNTSPASLFGGTWEALEEGYALWTTTTGDGGDTIDAGLPNITGSITDGSVYGNYFVPNSNVGALGYTLSKQTNLSGGSGSQDQLESITFDASNSNSIYGNSTTVQPPAIKIYAWKRIY